MPSLTKLAMPIFSISLLDLVASESILLDYSMHFKALYRAYKFSAIIIIIIKEEYLFRIGSALQGVQGLMEWYHTEE